MTDALAVPRIILITGIMASGKSTVAQHLAERLPKSVHVRGDLFRRMIVSGRAEVTADFPADAAEQLRLRYRLAALVTAEYLKAGFPVVCQDVILGPMLSEVVDLLRQHCPDDPLHVVVLCPSPEVAAARDSARSKTGYGDWTPDALDHSLRTETPRLGLWLDNSDQTVEQTVDTILAQLSDSAV